LALVIGCAAWAHEFTTEVGILPESGNVDWNGDSKLEYTTAQGILYLELGVKFELLAGFFVGGDVKTYMLPSAYTSLNFVPFYTDYVACAGWTHDWFTLGWEHMCAHSVDPLGYLAKEPILAKDCSYDKVYMKGKFKF